MRNLRTSFFTGLLTLLPIWLVWVVFKFVFGMLSDVSRPLVSPLLALLATRDPKLLGWLADAWVQTAIALFATMIFVLLVGVMARRVAGIQFIRWFEALIGRIPLAKSVYGSARQLLDMLQTKPDGSQRVVLIDFPHKHMKSVGFVTRIFNDARSGREIAAVYVPTTPNPTGGYLELVPIEELTPTDWSVDQAMTFILSGGAVSPEKNLPYDKSMA